jgi:hypothetical protein
VASHSLLIVAAASALPPKNWPRGRFGRWVWPARKRASGGCDMNGAFKRGRQGKMKGARSEEREALCRVGTLNKNAK